MNLFQQKITAFPAAAAAGFIRCLAAVVGRCRHRLPLFISSAAACLLTRSYLYVVSFIFVVKILW
jgi:hypothetical protein